jgi:hypothetical protein
LEGALRTEAEEALEDIARALLKAGPALFAEVSRPQAASVAGGHGGVALFFAYLAMVRDEGEGPWTDVAEAHLEQAMAIVAEEVTTPDLYSGFLGVAWVLEHLEGRLWESTEDGLLEIDEALEDLLSEPDESRSYELIRGLAGFGTYALERRRRSASVAGSLEKILAYLDGWAQRSEGGWWTPPELLPPWQREVNPTGYLNLGAAHGLPGVLPLLAATEAAGIAPETARRLLDGAVLRLLAEELPPGSPARFPAATSPLREPAPSRLAWCYGDPGIAAALHCAGRRGGRESWCQKAVEMARQAAKRPFEGSQVVDAGLCHGAAGLAHLFNRLHQASGDELIGDAARSWFERCLALRTSGKEGESLAGFRAWNADAKGQGAWTADAGWLTGVAGIGLALLAAVSAVPPEWDRLLAVSAAP